MVCQNSLLVFFLPFKLFLLISLFYWFFLSHQLVNVSMCKDLVFSVYTGFLGDLTQNHYLKFNLYADDLQIYIYSLYYSPQLYTHVPIYQLNINHWCLKSNMIKIDLLICFPVSASDKFIFPVTQESSFNPPFLSCLPSTYPESYQFLAITTTNILIQTIIISD